MVFLSRISGIAGIAHVYREANRGYRLELENFMIEGIVIMIDGLTHLEINLVIMCNLLGFKGNATLSSHAVMTKT